MSKISSIKQSILLCRAAGVTPFVWGHRGLGKSSLVKQICALNGWGVIDLRLSQVEASDIRGLPGQGKDGRTHYLPPAEMPIGDLTDEQIKSELGDPPEDGDLEHERTFSNKLQAMQSRFQHGILFLDEVNRAADDVLQSVFQLVLDRRVGQYVLPPGWSIVAAGNYMEGYITNGFNDPAFLDRFCHIMLSGGELTLEEWVEYMSQVHGGDASDVIEYASQNMDHLDGNISGELGFQVQPSRRSWDSVVKVYRAFREGNYREEALTDVVAGLVGQECAIAFQRYSCPVKPKQILNDGVKKHSSKLKKLDRNQLTGLMWGLVSYCKDKINDDGVGEICCDFAEHMAKHASDKDIVVAFCRALITGNDNDGQSNIRAAALSNPKLAEILGKHRKESGNTEKTFIDRLNDRPELQGLLSRIAWGSGDDED